MPPSLLLEIKEKILLALLYRRAEGLGHPTCPQLLTALLFQCWSQLANEAGSPRAANDIFLPCQFSCCGKLYVGLKPQSCARSPDMHFF